MSRPGFEPLAEPEGICVTEPVFGQVRNKIPNRLEKLAPQVLKNVRYPFDIYRVVMPWRGEGPPSTDRGLRGLAVLPFANISPDPNDEYFADGLTEELISVLSQVGELRVIARTSVTPYKSTSKGVSQIGEELGVSSILEGSVRKAGNRLRITVQLIDVASQGHVWAHTYDRELDDIFALQSDIAKQVAEALKVKLLAREEARLDRRALSRPDSYLEYLQGRTRMHDFSEEAMRAAKEHFERAIQLDGRNAAAHAGLADVSRFLGGMYRHLPKPEWEAVSREHAARAIELDPDLAEAHASLALILWDDYEFREAEREFQRTLSLNPSLAWARTFYADLLADQDRSEEALREFALAEELDPLSTVTFGEEIQLMIILRRLDVAASRLEKLGRVENFGLLYHNCRFSLCLALGDVEQGLREIDAMNELLPGRPEVVTGYAMHFASVGKEKRARELLRPMEALPEPIRPASRDRLGVRTSRRPRCVLPLAGCGCRSQENPAPALAPRPFPGACPGRSKIPGAVEKDEPRMTLNGLVWPELHNPLDSEWQLASISGTQGKTGPKDRLAPGSPRGQCQTQSSLCSLKEDGPGRCATWLRPLLPLLPPRRRQQGPHCEFGESWSWCSFCYPPQWEARSLWRAAISL